MILKDEEYLLDWQKCLQSPFAILLKRNGEEKDTLYWIRNKVNGMAWKLKGV
jgi:hypothetical protein